MELLTTMFKENTGRSMLDSGDYYGRAWERNQSRDFDKEPQAQLKISEWGPEVTVSTYQHCTACLELDDVCNAFNALPYDDWEGGYGYSQRHADFLERIGAEVETAWNSYNWENNFDQTLQGARIEINGEQYTLLQVHGGCDVRGGYTDARLFKIQDWMADYWLDDTAEFCIDQPSDPDPNHYDYVVFETQPGGYSQLYDPNLQDNKDIPEGFWETIPHQTVEGIQRAVEH